MRKPLPTLDKQNFPSTTDDGYRWLDLIRNYTYDLKEYTVNVDLPSLSADTTITQSVTVPGVAVGDYVLHIEYSSVSDEFVVLHGRVSAADTITVQVHRGKAGSYDPAAEDWTFLVLKNTR